MFRAASAGTKSRVLLLFGYTQTALNADATFEFHPHECGKGLLPTILLRPQVCQGLVYMQDPVIMRDRLVLTLSFFPTGGALLRHHVELVAHHGNF